MSDKFVEKNFLYLLALSVLLHLAVFGVLSRLESEKPKVKNEPMMVDLTAVPDLPTPPVEAKREPQQQVSPPRQKVIPPPMQTPSQTRLAERIDNVPPPPGSPTPRKEARSAPRASADAERAGSAKAPPVSQEGLRQAPDYEARSGSGSDIFRARKGKEVDLSKFFPSQKQLASLEEGYRKKYEGAEQGDTRMMDTDDPTIAVFSHRLLVAANDSLKLLARRTPSHGVGVGVLQVTIRRDGTVENVKMVETTRSAALDSLALTAVRETGYVGPLPKKWQHEKLNLLWIFVSSQSPQGY